MWHFLWVSTQYDLDFEDLELWQGLTVKLMEHRLSEKSSPPGSAFVVEWSR